ncbi:CRAL/TRIO domain protein [Toxoplasma gondii GAB2-2007-GAL-DOM2]|uniref:CRAL/TRIO domain protein n=3 Tax=Toxoplasma gondii TaxID=5811 RepID=V4YPF4_TOXGV|nr:CRAL/TRIO domain protein [Toxoplasma gondii VEG]KFG36446.1 CRAL/TRIO domain protein [Toxoplasma gondii p89]KFG41437.1 CRAL/TRIO domain protein [Toxoplasma gondii GAB2-2007-GAL-DOM2]CEL71872.1 TPA: hypothetical protein BN1205_052000 [Toxoplasma gondii VEG]
MTFSRHCASRFPRSVLPSLFLPVFRVCMIDTGFVSPLTRSRGLRSSGESDLSPRELVACACVSPVLLAAPACFASFPSVNFAASLPREHANMSTKGRELFDTPTSQADSGAAPPPSSRLPSRGFSCFSPARQKKKKPLCVVSPLLVACLLLAPACLPCGAEKAERQASVPLSSSSRAPRHAREKKGRKEEPKLVQAVSGGGQVGQHEPELPFDSISVDRRRGARGVAALAAFDFNPDEEGSREQRRDSFFLASTEFRFPDSSLAKPEKNALCRDWRVPHPFLSKEAAKESLQLPPNLNVTAVLMPFYFYDVDNRGNYLILTKFSDFDIPVIRRRLSKSDIRLFFRFKNLAWFGRLAPSPNANSVVVSDAAGIDMAKVVFHGGLSVAKTYVQAMTSTIDDIGIRVSEIHIINVPRAAACLLKVVQSLSPSEIKFFTYTNRQEFLDRVGDVIGRQQLPRHFGGTNPTRMDKSKLESCFTEFVRQLRTAQTSTELKDDAESDTTYDQQMEKRFHQLFD